MGYMRHNAIIVTGYDERIDTAYHKAKEIFSEPWDTYGSENNLVSAIVDSITNGYRSFFIAPDGSKEGWSTSKTGDERRDKFIEWLEKEEERLHWVEVQYGDDELYTKIVRDSDEKNR